MSNWNPLNWPMFRRGDHGYATPANDLRQQAEDDGRPWSPPLRSTDQDIIGARPYLESRLKEQAQLSGLMQGAIDLTCTLAIGKGPRLQSTPMWQGIPGATEEWAKDFSDTIEREWRAYIGSNDNLVDAGRRFSFYSLLWQAYRVFLTTGEILAVPKLTKGQLKNSTSIMLIDPARLATDPTSRNKDEIKAGIELDDNGAVKAYHVASANPRETHGNKLEYTRTKPRGKTGRKLVLHYLDPVGSEQTRGISPFASAVEGIKDLGDLNTAQLRAAQLQSAYVLSIESELTNQEVELVLGGPPTNNGTRQGSGGKSSKGTSADPSDAMADYVRSTQKRSASYLDSRDTGLQGVMKRAGRGIQRALQLLPGQKVDFKTAQISPNLEGLEKVNQQQIARGVGLSVETLTGDYSKLSFSGGSISLAIQKAQTGAMAERVLVPFIRDIFVLWLEVFLMTDEGASLLPPEADFWSYKDQLSACTIKMGLPLSPDEQKKAKALEIQLENRIISLQDAADQMGVDLESSLLQQKREQDTVDHLELRNLKSNVQEKADEYPDDESSDEDEPEAA